MKKKKKRNPIAADLRTPKYRLRRIEKQNRRKKTNDQKKEIAEWITAEIQ